MNEAGILRLAKMRLKFGKMTGEVIWWARLQAGSMGAMALCPSGTPDLVAVIDQQNGSVAILFMECKSLGKKLAHEQREFFNGMNGKPKVMCVVIDGKGQIGAAIEMAKRI